MEIKQTSTAGKTKKLSLPQAGTVTAKLGFVLCFWTRGVQFPHGSCQREGNGALQRKKKALVGLPQHLLQFLVGARSGGSRGG